MRNLTFTATLILSLFLIACSNCGNKEIKINTLSKVEQEQGWKLLFNGKDLNGWKKFKGDEVTGWVVKDGILHNSGVGSDHGGDIITKEQFDNFELVLEWKIDSASNSGVFYRVQEDSVKAIYQSGPEYQLLDDNGWPTNLDESQYSGANYAMNKPTGAKVKPLDEWNSTKIIVNGSHVEHWLNEVKVVEYELWSDAWEADKEAGKWKNEPFYGIAKTGHIGIQDHGGLTMFRNIKIRQL